MKKSTFSGICVLILVIFAGCGGGDGGSTSSSASVDITGHYEGTIHYYGRWFNEGDWLNDYHTMTADLTQSGSVVTGFWQIISGSEVITSGFFESTTLSGTTISGIMNDNGQRFWAPFHFTGTADGTTFTGLGDMSWCGDWETDFTLTRV